jgi:ABC-type multidrug transport system fused ATPase/permease subunit
MWSTVDSVADKMPQYSKIKEFLLVKECVGKSVIEDDKRPAPVSWPSDGSIEMDGVSFNCECTRSPPAACHPQLFSDILLVTTDATDAPNALTRISLSIKSGEKIGVCGRT